MRPVLAVLGPTATGKSSLALTMAERLDIRPIGMRSPCRR